MDKQTQKTLTLKQNMLWNMLGSAVGLACQWAISILVVRLAPDLNSAGLYSLAMSVYGIFSPIAQFGMYTYIITDMDGRNSIGEYVSLSIATGFAALLLTSGYALLTCRPNSWPIIIAFAVYKGIATVIDIFHAADQKSHRMDYIGISLALQGLLSLGSFAAVYLISCNLTYSIIAMGICTLGIGLIYDLPRTRTLHHLHLGISLGKAKTILCACSLIVFSCVLNGGFASLPRQFLSQELGDAALGIYASIATPVAIIQVGSTYIYNPLIGYFAESFHSGDRSKFIQLIKGAVLGIVAIGLVSLFGAAILGRPLLALLYGNEVASYSAVMMPLIASSVLLGVSGFLGNLLVAVRALPTMIIGSGVSFAIVVASAATCIEYFGMNGATLSLIAGCIGSIAVSCFGVFKQAKNHFSVK